MAIRSVANQIQVGEIDCGLAVGIESMSNHSPEKWDFSTEVKGAHQEADDCKMPMGWTSENVAGDFGISREKMDAFAARSHERAANAQSSGRFDAEILPITVPDGTSDNEQRNYKTVSADDGIRVGSTPEGLGKIKPAFPQWAPAQTTGGNASQLTDGAAGVILMRRSMANKLGKKIIAKYVATSVSGLAPRIMGIGPSLAIPRVLELTGIDQSQVELFEINEAFASMAVYCEEKLGINPEILNVNGGAIALGHPLGAVSLTLELMWS
jgi:acetyl-CoA acyltransferase 1